ncbi:hypothetical protein K466DRAFT_330896 [Polyporus arcularius HHB13444]|uniref:Uncharacterized protein n=1 Tax=Polyporus arcularius HHB13444 TaxID=1314778 RepID=A0A5C3NZ75_9APHY|nr:hypothetical protein K466DRAFT_330896 [Polyporus arcularius HHB13444]
MNCSSSTRQPAPHHISLATFDFVNDWKTGCCPAAAMLELVQAGIRILLIAAAGVALAFAGIVVSVLAYLRELYIYNARRKEGAGQAIRVATPPHHLRDRDTTSPIRNPRPRRNVPKPALSPIPASPLASASTPMSLATPLQSSSRESSRTRQEPISRKRSSPRKHVNRVGSPSSTASSETACDFERTPRSAALVPSRPLPPLQSSDSSPQASTDSSVASISSEEQGESPSRGVLKRIRSQHSTLRDRCLIRAQSIPTQKAPRNPRRRTDPYQAPYYFPTPLSPDAGTYLQEVISERHGRSPVNATVVEKVRFASLPSSPSSLRETQDLPEPNHTLSVPSPSQGEAEQTAKATRRHRWSWHMPHLPERTRSADSDRNTRGTPEKHHRDGFPRFKFGHNKRRSVGVEDVASLKAT